MRIYKITTRHSQLTDVSTPHTQSDISGVGFQKAIILPYDYSEIVQGDWTLYATSSQFLNGYFENTNTHANGDAVKYYIYLAKGTYTIIMLGAKKNNFGILGIDIDDTNVANFDLYDASTSVVYNQRFIQTGINVTSDGIKTIKIYVNGKNANSSDYYVQFSYIIFVRTA